MRGSYPLPEEHEEWEGLTVLTSDSVVLIGTGTEEGGLLVGARASVETRLRRTEISGCWETARQYSDHTMSCLSTKHYKTRPDHLHVKICNTHAI